MADTPTRQDGETQTAFAIRMVRHEERARILAIIDDEIGDLDDSMLGVNPVTLRENLVRRIIREAR